MNSWLSLLGLMQYRPDVLDLLLLPDAISRETLTNNLLLQCGELELLYSMPDTFKSMVGYWSKKRLPIWNELESTLHYDYNPIYNYDRTEENNRTETRNLKETEDRTFSSEQSTTQDSTTSGTTNTDKTGYDSETLVPADETRSSGDVNITGTDRRKDIDDIDRTDTGTIGNVENVRAYGNIGVTTTQQMIQSQREVVQFDIYQYIIDDFKKEFCLLVY